MKSVIALLLAAGLPATLCADERMMRWNEIPRSFVMGRKVEVRLADDTVLHGKVVSATPDGLRLAISKARRGAGKYQRGESLVPAAEITVLKVNRTGVKGRIIGTAIGGGITVTLMGTLLAIASNEGTSIPAGIAAGMLVPAATGYFLGWARDRNIVTIHVVP
jgi:hypothetical protein